MKFYSNLIMLACIGLCNKVYAQDISKRYHDKGKMASIELKARRCPRKSGMPPLEEDVFGYMPAWQKKSCKV